MNHLNIDLLSKYCQEYCAKFNKDCNKNNSKKVLVQYLKCSYLSCKKEFMIKDRFNCKAWSLYFLDNYIKLFVSNHKLETYFNVIKYRNFTIKNDYKYLICRDLKLTRNTILMIIKIKHKSKNNPKDKYFIDENIKNLLVNYAILLNSIGRTIRSIYIYRRYNLNKIDDAAVQGNIGMAIGMYANATKNLDLKNLSIKIIHKAIYLYDHQISSHPNDIFYFKNLEKDLNYLYVMKCKPIHTENNNLKIKKDRQYRAWTCTNNLLLNVLNDFYDQQELYYDTLQISRLIYKYRPEISNLYNLIKQKYVSARYCLYEGVYTILVLILLIENLMYILLIELLKIIILIK